MSRELQDRDWRTLVLTIIQGDCILMLGPDAVTDEAHGSRQPLLNLFAQHLIDMLPADVSESLAGATLAQAAQVYRSRSGAGANDLLLEAQEFFADRKRTIDPVLANLAALPFKLIINTTPGLQMEDALRAANPPRDCRSAFYRAKWQKVDMVPEGTTERPLVYHLYGSVSELKSLVLTDNDLLDFLVAVVSEDPPLPHNISSAFGERDKSFLFLGFGFRHWYLRILLHVLYKGRAENRSFALERFDERSGRTDIHTTKLFFQEGHKIDFFDMDLLEFTTELRRRVEQKTRDRQQESRPSDAGEAHGPRVFICHASEDKDYARELSRRLEERALRPWLDEKSLRGGTRWDDEIRRVIKEDVDYVLVLQSRALVAQTEGYVVREIKIALDRQQAVRSPYSFLIPLVIDESRRLDETKDLQSIDVRTPEGFDRLVSTINRDQQLRRKGSS